MKFSHFTHFRKFPKIILTGLELLSLVVIWSPPPPPRSGTGRGGAGRGGAGLYCLTLFCLPLYCLPLYCLPLYCLPIYCLPLSQGDWSCRIVALEEIKFVRMPKALIKKGSKQSRSTLPPTQSKPNTYPPSQPPMHTPCRSSDAYTSHNCTRTLFPTLHRTL